MIIVRDIFRLKFGQSKEATGYWKQAVAALRKAGFQGAKDIRLLTDLAGPAYYTVVLESTFDSLAAWESAHRESAPNAEWKSLYAKIIPLTESGRREILTLVE